MQKTKIKIGIDEAGRGPWAGPVIACALAWNPNNMPGKEFISLVNDSKKLTEKKREELYGELITLSLNLPSSQPSPLEEKGQATKRMQPSSPNKGEEIQRGGRGAQLYFGVGVVDNYMIDEINIRQANREAMRRAIVEIQRKIPKELSEVSVVVDGRDNYEFKELSQKPLYIVGGDGKVSEIGAASIIAKVFRDKLMKQYATLYPELGLDTNAGYGTKKHKENLQKVSDITGIHRTSYKPIKEVLEKKEKVLVHICCGPDATVPLMDLKDEYEVIAYWYDPNIQPQAEEEKRFQAFVKVCEIEGVEYIRGEYDVKNFFKKIKGLEHTPERGEKCTECYDMRLERTARLAREMGITKWTSSLNNSPHKDMEKMFGLGEKWDKASYLSQALSLEEREQAAKILGITPEDMLKKYDEASSLLAGENQERCREKLEFLKVAFRKNGGFQRSVDYTNEHDIYRQNYCGCVYSDTFPGSPRNKNAKGGFSG